MRTAMLSFAMIALACGACAKHKEIVETPLATGTRIDAKSIYLGWIAYGSDEDYYKHGYRNKEEWLALAATLNQSYHGWVSPHDGARSPADQPKEGQYLLGVKDVHVPGELKAGDKWVSAVVYLQEPTTRKIIFQAEVDLKADSWGFESALNQATYHLAQYVKKVIGRL